MTVPFEKVPPRREREQRDGCGELPLQKGLVLAEQESLLNCESILFTEFLAVCPEENRSVTEGIGPVRVNEVTVIAVEEVCQNEHVVAFRVRCGVLVRLQFASSDVGRPAYLGDAEAEGIPALF